MLVLIWYNSINEGCKKTANSPIWFKRPLGPYMVQASAWTIYFSTRFTSV